MKSKKYIDWQVANFAKSYFVEIGRALFNPGKLWVVSVAVGGGWESGGLGLRELPGATGATSRGYPTEQSIPLAEDLLKIS